MMALRDHKMLFSSSETHSFLLPKCAELNVENMIKYVENTPQNAFPNCSQLKKFQGGSCLRIPPPSIFRLRWFVAPQSRLRSAVPETGTESFQYFLVIEVHTIAVSQRRKVARLNFLSSCHNFNRFDQRAFIAK